MEAEIGKEKKGKRQRGRYVEEGKIKDLQSQKGGGRGGKRMGDGGGGNLRGGDSGEEGTAS